jgi:cell division protein FtsB
MTIDVNRVLDKMASRIALLHREMAIIEAERDALAEKVKSLEAEKKNPPASDTP